MSCLSKTLSKEACEKFRSDYRDLTCLCLENYLNVLWGWLKELIDDNRTYRREEVLAIALYREWLGNLIALQKLFQHEYMRESQAIFRGMFEVFVQFMFYLDDPGEMDKKFICYQLMKDFKNLSRAKEELAKLTQRNTDIAKFIDNNVRNCESLYREDKSKYASDKRLLLEANKRIKNWYQLYDSSISNLRVLCHKIRFGEHEDYANRLYSFMYGLLSEKTHGFDALDSVYYGKDGHLQVLAMKNPYVSHSMMVVLAGMFNVFVPKINDYFSHGNVIFKVSQEFVDNQNFLLGELENMQDYYTKHCLDINAIV